MSALVLVGIPLIAITVIALSETEIVRIIKELIDVLIRTTSYTSDKIVQILRLYF